MVKTVLEIDGMMCGMCEAHVNDAIRAAFEVKSVKSSHKKNQTEILSEQPLDENKLRDVLQPTGYLLKGIRSEENVKKGLFRK